jgi:hypothetical protein
MASNINVSPGSLDSLLNQSFPAADFTSVSVQSVTGVGISPSGSITYSTVTLNTTGVPGPGTTPGEVLKIVGVNDTENSITFSLTLDGQPITQVTDFVNGYSSGSLLISGLNTAGIADTPPSFLNNVVGVLSSAPIPAQTSLTFSLSGSSNITPPPTPPPTPTPPWLPTLGPPNNFFVSDQSTTSAYAGGSWQSQGPPYSGPVAGLTSEFIAVTPDNINITAQTPNVFISLDGGSGEDAIAVNQANGNNVLNGSTGSSFLYGGTGNDTFFVDDRNPPAGSSIWSTVVGFHSGDAATIWGITPSDFTLSWVDGQGATGYTGLTLHATAAGVPTASLTLAGFTSAGLTDGKLTVSFGTTAATGGVAGSTYMYVHAN